MHQGFREYVLKGLVEIRAFNIWNTPHAIWSHNSMKGEYYRNSRGWHRLICQTNRETSRKFPEGRKKKKERERERGWLKIGDLKNDIGRN